MKRGRANVDIERTKREKLRQGCYMSFFPFLASAYLAGAVLLSVLPSPPLAADFGRV